MDDTKQKQQGQDQNQPQPQPQMGGVSTLVKERELPVDSSAGPSVSEFVRPSEVEPKIRPELEEIGVRVPESPKVESADITHAKESVPVKTEPSGLSQIPMTEEEARQALKHEEPTNSNWGYLATIIKFFKTIHHGLLVRKN